jgi:hypothetical protein
MAKVNPKSEQIEIVVRLNRIGIGPDEVWDSGFVYFPAHPQFKLRSQPQTVFNNLGEVEQLIRDAVKKAGLQLKKSY